MTAIDNDRICQRCGQRYGMHFSATDRCPLPDGSRHPDPAHTFVADAPALSNDTLKMQVGGDHYMEHGNMQPWVIIDHYSLNYWEGNALKYLLRSKDPSKRVEDLRKAAHCLEHQAQRLEKLTKGDK